MVVLSRFPFNKAFLFLLGVAVLSLALMRATGVERLNLSATEKVMVQLLAPLQGGVTVVVEKTGGIWRAIWSYGQVQAENEALRQQLGKLQEENNRLREYQMENLRLRDLLQYKEENLHRYDLVPAMVIARNPGNWFKTLTINRGSADGIQTDMAVITDKGLVGRIQGVTPHTAQVLLITDRDQAVGGMVQLTREPGNIMGLSGTVEASETEGLLQMIHLRHDAPVSENLKVITSGLGGVFPKGIPIGRVIKVESNGLLKVATVRPHVDFYRLEEVMVIRQILTTGE